MKNLFFPLFIFLSTVTLAQKKELTLKESVLKQRALSPDRINNFLWIPGTYDYSYCSADWKSLLKSSVSSDKELELVKIDDINSSLKTAYGNFFGVSWLSENELLLNDGQTISKWNVSSKTSGFLRGNKTDF